MPILAHIYDKAQHATAFAVLALLLDFSFPGSRLGWKKVSALVAYGAAIEIWQKFLPYRSAELLDLMADVVGLALYALALPLIRRAPILRRRWLPNPP